MPDRIVIHAGFHKTGTSSVQHVLRDNRAALRPMVRSVLKGVMRDVLHASRGFSTWRDPFSLIKFRARFQTLLEKNAAMPQSTLCVSAEELSGHLPGRGDLMDYSAAPDLAVEMASVAAECYPHAKVCFFYSTREPDVWLKSAYWEHVKSSSLTLDWDAFDNKYRAAADLNGIVAQIAERVSCPVYHTPLEASRSLPAGPATPLLKLCGVPPNIIDTLTRSAPVNEQQDQTVLLALLAANRDYPERNARKAAKLAILKAAREKPL